MTYPEFLSEWTDNKDYIIVRTSGSTGDPKSIRLSKEFVKESALRTNRVFKIDSDSRLHSCISPDFIGGKMMLVRSQISGASLTWEEPSNRPLKDFSRKDRIDLVAVVPSQMEHIIENEAAMPEIRVIIVGGAPLSTILREKIAKSRFNVFETYGMTETASHIALKKIGSENNFKTLEGIQVSKDDRGCLVIRFKDGEKIVTNDLAEVISDREFHIRGRIDNVINSGGKKINPLDLEEKISGFCNRPFIITGIPDEKWGERIVMMIEGSGNEGEIGLLKEKIRTVLPGWQIPKEIIYVDSLPRTSGGKVLRSSLNLSLLLNAKKARTITTASAPKVR